MLAGGTDGEDGPTNAAGAFVTQQVVQTASVHGLSAGEYLARNDAYHFFERSGGLFITGPTQTNVCDLRVVAVEQINRRSNQAARFFPRSAGNANGGGVIMFG